MAEIKDILKQEVKKYAGDGHGARLRLYSIADDACGAYTVIAIDDPRNIHEQSELVVVFARLQDNHIIIEVDNTDAPLLDALLQQGIPRASIVRAYAGETIPETVNAPGD